MRDEPYIIQTISNHVFVVPGCLEEPNDEVPIEGHHVVPKQQEVLVEGRHKEEGQQAGQR